MSRYQRPASPLLRCCLASLPVLLAASLLWPAIARAGVIAITGETYSLDGGPPVSGSWELAEKIAVAGDVAIVVADKNVKPDTLQTLLQLLYSLKVPTLLAKKADYKILVDRGVVKPTKTAP